MTHHTAQSRNLALGAFAMALVVVASNLLVERPALSILGVPTQTLFGFAFGDYVTWAAFTYPVAFLVTDLMNRHFGPGAARRVIAVGFVIGVVMSFLLGTPRIALASGTAFLAAQLLDVAVFDRLRAGVWWRAPLVSSVIASTLDSALFWPLAFAGSDFVGWPTYALVDYAVKLTITLGMLLPFRALSPKVA